MSIRCVITGTPVGTDTRPTGRPCACENCRIVASADLLARVRAGCCYTLTETPAKDGWPEFESQLSLTGPPELVRELAEALSNRSCSSQSE